MLKNAIEKYGKNAFECEIIDTCNSAKELNEKEAFYIEQFNSLAPNGYNLMTGGATPQHSQLTRKKMSQTRKGKEPHWATKASHTPESNKKRYETLLANGHYVWTEEKKEKARHSAKERAKQIVDQDNILYESIADAARKTDCHRACIQKILKGKAKKTKSKNGKTYVFKQGYDA